MNNIKFNLWSKILLITGTLLLVYGIIATNIPIYIFWESESLGWAVLFIGLAVFLNYNRIIRKKDGKKSVLIIIGIVILIFILFIQFILIVIFPFTDAYSAANKHIRNDSLLTKEIGIIKDIQLLPSGNFQKTSNLEGVQGTATIKFLIKGEITYKIIKIHLSKEINTDWLVNEINY